MDVESTKQVKLRVHPTTFCEKDLIVNTAVLSKNKFKVEVGDIVEISALEANQNEASERLCFFLEIEYVPQDIQSKGGPLSIRKEVVQVFNFEGVKEVVVRRVEREEVALDLVELRFKDQSLTRSDMWRFTRKLADSFVFLSRKVEHSGIRVQVSKLWSFEGGKATSGIIMDKTRVVFRSASVEMFLFIQISTEMWNFDPSGDLYFDKAVGGFLKELFQRWKDESCNHEVTLVFFWRVFYDQPTFEDLLPGVQTSVQRDKKGRYYEDFYRVIVTGESLADWSCKLVHIKQNFVHLKETMAKIRGKGARISSSDKGNILEAMNMGVNVFQNHYIDCNFSITGQQVVIVTAGVGVFEVDHNLTRLTKERIIDGGVGVDLVCLTEQPLHAVPLFQFQICNTLDSSEYYHIPHWINYSFYSPPHSTHWSRYQPRLQLSDHLVNEHLSRGRKKSKGSKLYNPFSDNTSRKVDAFEDYLQKQIDLRDDDLYAVFDTSIFSDDCSVVSVNKGQSSIQLRNDDSQQTLGVLTQHRSHEESSHFSVSPDKPIMMTVGGSFDADKMTDPFETPSWKEDEADSSSSLRKVNHMQDARSISREGIFPTSLHPSALRARVYSEDSSFTSSKAMMASSANSFRQFYLPGALRSKGSEITKSRGTRKKRAFINPFDPSRLHADLTAYQRRWMHVFPRNKHGVAFQIHHLIQEEKEKENPDSDNSNSLQTSVEQGNSPFTNSSGESRDGRQHRWSEEKLSLRASGSLHNQDGRSSSPNADTFIPQTTNLTSGSGLWMKNVSGSCHSLHTQDDYHSDITHWNKAKSKHYKADLHSDSEQSGNHGKRKSIPIHKQTQVFTVGLMTSQNIESKTENFASARRLGTDWPSLTEPACLPVTTDFFPSQEKLATDFFEYPTKLVASTYSFGSGESSGEKTTPSWITDHQDVSTSQVYSEMISQRLSQGFQMVFESKTKCKDTENSVFSLHKSLQELSEATSQSQSSDLRGPKKRKKRFKDISVKLSLGRVFQKVELNYPDIIIWIYRPKLQEDTHPVLSTYQLSTAGMTTPIPSGDVEEEEDFESRHVEFGHTRVEEYNWNYLDQHICGYSDFEVLGESQKYLRCRYLLLPSEPLDPKENNAVNKEEVLVANFVRFLEFLNHIKRSGQGGSRLSSRRGSLQGNIYKRQNSLPVPTASSRTSPSESHSNLKSPFPTKPLVHKLLEIEGAKGHPSRSKATPLKGVDSGSRFRPKSPFMVMGSSHPKLGTSEPRKQGMFTSASNSDLGSLVQPHDHEGVAVREDNKSRRSQAAHMRTNSQDLSKMYNHRDDLSILRDTDDLRAQAPHKNKGSPQLLRRTAVEEQNRLVSNPTNFKQELSFGPKKDSSSTAVTSPPHTPKHSNTGPMKKSSDGSLPINVTPSTPSDEGSREDTISRRSNESSSCGVDALSSISPLNSIAESMANLDDGIDFLCQLPRLGSSCFVAMEAVTWVIEHVSGIDSRKEAVKLLQNMASEQLIIHASRDFKIPFVDGYYLYHLPVRDSIEGVEPPKENMERSFILVAEMDFEKFSKCWFEVRIVHPSSCTDVEHYSSQNTLSTFAVSPSSMSSLLASSDVGRTSRAFYMHFEEEEGVDIPASMLNRYIELNPDTQSRSDRPEWVYVRYDHTYHPRCAFQLEFQWMVATMNLLYQLIQSWLYKATMCGFNLIPVPTLQTLSHESKTHPFQQQYFIPLTLPSNWSNSESLIGPSSHDTGTSSYDALHKLFDAIINKFGFFLDPTSLPQDSDVLTAQYESTSTSSFLSHFYIHYSGTALVQPVYDVERDQSVISEHFSPVGEDTVYSSAVDINTVGSDGSDHKGLSSIPIGRSTPIIGSSGMSRSKESSVHEGKRTRCGFYWYKNRLYLRQKNTSATMLEQCDKLLAKLTSFCSDENMELSDLCNTILSKCEDTN